MSVSEFRGVAHKAIAGFEQRKKAEALAALEAKAREMGFSLADLAGGKSGKAVSAPKYQDPNDPTRTWTGRGRKPGWFQAALDAGTPPEEMLIA
ncbi:H-NS histone family protein [Marinovum algicola]